MSERSEEHSFSLGEDWIGYSRFDRGLWLIFDTATSVDGIFPASIFCGHRYESSDHAIGSGMTMPGHLEKGTDKLWVDC